MGGWELKALGPLGFERSYTLGGARENTVPVLLLPSFLRLCRAVDNIMKALLLRSVSSQAELTSTGYLTIARQP